MSNYLITGGSSGIGLSVARTAKQQGHNICILDANITDATRDEFNTDSCLLVEGSVASASDCRDATEQCIAKFGSLDGLSHNAGIQRYGTSEDTSDALWDEVIAVNLTGAFYMARAVLPHLRQSKGSIVFMGSVQSLASQNNVAVYTTAKHGMFGLTKSIALDFARDGVRCNMVAPGAVDTPMLQWAISLDGDADKINKILNGMHPPGRVAKPDEVANVVMFLLSNQASFVNGESVRVDGGMLMQLAGAPED